MSVEQNATDADSESRSYQVDQPLANSSGSSTLPAPSSATSPAPLSSTSPALSLAHLGSVANRPRLLEIRKMPVQYEQYVFQNAINPKTRVTRFGNLRGAAFVITASDLPTWQVMQELGPQWAQPVDVVIKFFDTEQLKHPAISAELVKMGFSASRVAKGRTTGTASMTS
jgi:hypothetical protein